MSTTHPQSFGRLGRFEVVLHVLSIMKELVLMLPQIALVWNHHNFGGGAEGYLGWRSFARRQPRVQTALHWIRIAMPL